MAVTWLNGTFSMAESTNTPAVWQGPLPRLDSKGKHSSLGFVLQNRNCPISLLLFKLQYSNYLWLKVML